VEDAVSVQALGQYDCAPAAEVVIQLRATIGSLRLTRMTIVCIARGDYPEPMTSFQEVDDTVVGKTVGYQRDVVESRPRSSLRRAPRGVDLDESVVLLVEVVARLHGEQ